MSALDAPKQRSVREPSPDDGPGEAGSESPASIGAYLSSQRRLRGISLDELATLTRIPLRSLGRLEAGAFDEQPDGFARGFVRTVAAALGLDPAETVTRMLSEPGAVADAQPSRTMATWRVVLLLAALVVSLVAAALPVWLRSRAQGETGASEPAAMTRRDPVKALAEAEGLAVLPSAALDASPQARRARE